MNKDLTGRVSDVIDNTLIYDIHTHLYPRSFGNYALYGFTELLNYHYLIAEYFRVSRNTVPSEFYSLTEKDRAKRIWQTLFTDQLPMSESTLGVINVLEKLEIGYDESFDVVLNRFNELTKDPSYFDVVLKSANVSKVIMTNDPLDENEIRNWGKLEDDRFEYSIRVDTFINYSGSIEFNGKTYYLPKQNSEYLGDCIELVNPKYLAISVSPDFNETTTEYDFITKTIIPLSVKYNVPISLMIGVNRQINPTYKLAGDGVLRKADLEVLAKLCAEFSEVKFMVTCLSRENQYELTVLSRKFSNLMPFGVWWFLNIPHLINEMTEMRISLLGNSFVPQHSDARVLEQLIYKWDRFRKVFNDILVSRFQEIQAMCPGILTDDRIEMEVKKFFSQNFKDFIK